MKKRFKIDARVKNCDLDFKGMGQTVTTNFVKHYGAYKEFLGELESFYLSLLELQKKAEKRGRPCERWTFKEAEGVQDTFIYVCKAAGAAYLVSLITMIKIRPNQLMQDTLRELMAGTPVKKRQPANPVFDDEDPYEPSQRLRSGKILIHLLNAQLDAEYTDAYDMHQKMQESITVDKSRAAQYPAGDQLIQSLYLDYGEVHGRTELVPEEVTEILASMPINDDTPTLQAFSGPAKPGGKPSAKPSYTSQANKVCYRALMGLKCPPESGKPCPGHDNNSEKDKLVALDQMIPRFADEIKWREERLKAMKDTKERMRLASNDRRALHALSADDDLEQCDPAEMFGDPSEVTGDY